MKHTKDDVKAMIYNMSGQISLGKGSKEDIKEVVALAKEHNLLSLVAEEFGDITRVLQVRS